LEPCIVCISQPEIDQMNNVGYMKTLLMGLEDMRPEIIVIMGSFVSQENTESQSLEAFKMYFESIGSIVRDNDLTCIRDLT
jgi:hypothetical protein